MPEEYLPHALALLVLEYRYQQLVPGPSRKTMQLTVTHRKRRAPRRRWNEPKELTELQLQS